MMDLVWSFAAHVNGFNLEHKHVLADARSDTFMPHVFIPSF